MTPTDIVIVNYNAGALLADGVRALLADDAADLRVTVVDNASTDTSLSALPADPRLAVIRNPANLGFAAACNIGAAAGRAETLLFLNPDCRMEPPALASLQAALCSGEAIGMVGGLLLNPDGTEQPGGRRDIPTPENLMGRFLGGRRGGADDYSRTGDPLPAGPIDIPVISGALMMVKRAAFDAVGGWDEGYFLHVEDIDLCVRFGRAGYRILFVPGARVMHVKGASSRGRPVFVEWHKHRGMLRFFRKFMAADRAPPTMALVTIAVWLRFSALATVLTARRLLGRG